MTCNREGAGNALIKVSQCGQMGKGLPTSSVILGKSLGHSPSRSNRTLSPTSFSSSRLLPLLPSPLLFCPNWSLQVFSISSKYTKYYGEFSRDCPPRSGGRRSIIVWLARFSGLVPSVAPRLALPLHHL